jgi:hypothetical protein
MLEDNKWKLDASCRGANIEEFFPLRISKDNSDRISKVMNLCDTCPVNAECLYDAVWHDSVGIWGRTTYRQRKYFISKLLSGDRYSVTLKKCSDFIKDLKLQQVIPGYKAYKADIQN